MANTHHTSRQRHSPNERPHDDSWVDQVADEVQALLAEHGLELELVVFYDKLTEVLHATGFDGSPARFFRSLEEDLRSTPDLRPPREPVSTG